MRKICLIFLRENTVEGNHCRLSEEDKQIWRRNTPEKNIFEVETLLERIFPGGILRENNIEGNHCRKSEEEKSLRRGEQYI